MEDCQVLRHKEAGPAGQNNLEGADAQGTLEAGAVVQDKVAVAAAFAGVVAAHKVENIAAAAQPGDHRDLNEHPEIETDLGYCPNSDHRRAYCVGPAGQTSFHAPVVACCHENLDDCYSGHAAESHCHQVPNDCCVCDHRTCYFDDCSPDSTFWCAAKLKSREENNGLGGQTKQNEGGADTPPYSTEKVKCTCILDTLRPGPASPRM